MANRAYKLAMVGIVCVIGFGAFMVFQGYYDDIYPVDRIRGHLSGIMASSDPETIRIHLLAIQPDIDAVLDKLPDNNNPVWIFPTETTNFGRISGDLDNMMESVNLAASLPQDSAAYATTMMDINSRALTVHKNLVEAVPYMYVSLSNIMFATIWIAAILGIFAVLKKRRDKLTQYGQNPGV